MSITYHEKILIVDDEEPVRTLIARFLGKVGYSCSVAQNAVEAKDALAEESFDLLITDLRMPGESGLDLITFAKEHYPRTGRLIITALSSQDMVREIMDVGVYGYIVKPFTRETVLITVENALRHLALDLDLQSSVNEMAKKILLRNSKLDAIMNNVNLGIIMVDLDMNIIETNNKMREWSDIADETVGRQCFNVLFDPANHEACLNCPMKKTLREGITCDVEKEFSIKQEMRSFRVVTSPIFNERNEVVAAIGLYEDITTKLMLESDLRQAQKLETVGQLAAGIAHEINTPVQYIGDNLVFLKDSFDEINGVLNGYEKLWQTVKRGEVVSKNLQQEIDRRLDGADLEYLYDEVPLTITQSLDGVRRVDKIVRAMKDFSHPGEEEKTLNCINKIVETTLTVCKNEWKYVAEVETDLLADLPRVSCFPGDISQALLNIVVNGAYAISDATDGGKNGMGKIFVRTSEHDGEVEILIQDSGNGIPEKIQSRVFDPFFTTKPRGKGTGQGLAIAHRVVVDKHKGSIKILSKEGEGTTFAVRLPVVQPAVQDE